MENLAIQYWKKAVEEHAENLMDDKLKITDELLEKVATKLLSDDEMWQAIDNCIEYHLYHTTNKAIKFEDGF